MRPSVATSDKEPPPQLQVDVLVGALERHGVEYLVVGGVAANSYGARRTTEDLDCLVGRERANLERLASAMRELGARIRAEGVSDEEAKALPLPLDGWTLANHELSTWTTDAGWFDVLTNIPARDGRRFGYEDLAPRSHLVQGEGFAIRAAALEDIVASKEWANRPKDLEALRELHEILSSEAGAHRDRPAIAGLVDQGHPTLPEQGQAPEPRPPEGHSLGPLLDASFPDDTTPAGPAGPRDHN